MSGTPVNPVPVRILVMGRHFLYLPLYVAQFDDPKAGKRPWFGKVPPQYSIEVKPPERDSDQKDKAVFDLLMDARPGQSDIMFAACDPTVLLGRQDENARMAAALIGSSAFWAVNHDAGNVRLISDLASFDRILCYEPGTTSNLIARRIAKRDASKLTIVGATDEIEQLEKLGEGTLALSPEVLKIANLLHGPLRPGEKRAKIVFELSTSKEFSNVLTTVLFTRADVVDEHPDLVSGVLSAIQCALLAIHAGDSVVKSAATSNFNDPYHLDEALSIAASGNVFPETIHVRHDRWQRACEFWYISQALADNREKNSLTKAEQLKAEELYTGAVLDRRLRRLVAEAITRGFKEALGTTDPKSPTTGQSHSRRLGVTLGLLCGGFVAGLAYASAADVASRVTGVSWTLALAACWLVGHLVGYERKSFLYAAHCASFVLSWWALHELAMPIAAIDAHFLPAVQLGDGLAGGILTLGSAWLIGAGFYVRSQSHEQAKNASRSNHGR